MAEGPAPSARRRAEARARGDVAFSPALAGAVALLAAAAALVMTAPLGASRIVALARHAFAPDADLAAIAVEARAAFAWCVGPAVLAAVGGVLVAGFVQTRGLVVARPARRPRESVLRALAFLAIAAIATFVSLRRDAATLQEMLRPSGTAPIALAIQVLARVALRVGFTLLVAGAADWALRYVRRERALRPTPDEARRERRDDEGDPRLRAEQRRRRHDG